MDTSLAINISAVGALITVLVGLIAALRLDVLVSGRRADKTVADLKAEADERVALVERMLELWIANAHAHRDLALTLANQNAQLLELNRLVEQVSRAVAGAATEGIRHARSGDSEATLHTDSSRRSRGPGVR